MGYLVLRNFKANMLVRFQMIAMAQFIVFLSIVRIKRSMTKKTFYFEAFRFWRHDFKQIKDPISNKYTKLQIYYRCNYSACRRRGGVLKCPRFCFFLVFFFRCRKLGCRSWATPLYSIPIGI